MWEKNLQRVYILMTPMCVIYDFWLLLLHIVNCGCLLLALILEGKIQSQSHEICMRYQTFRDANSRYSAMKGIPCMIKNLPITDHIKYIYISASLPASFGHVNQVANEDQLRV